MYRYIIHVCIMMYMSCTCIYMYGDLCIHSIGGSGVSAAVKCADLTECCLGDNEDDPNMWLEIIYSQCPNE